jgi:hypothetical protein
VDRLEPKGNPLPSGGPCQEIAVRSAITTQLKPKPLSDRVVCQCDKVDAQQFPEPHTTVVIGDQRRELRAIDFFVQGSQPRELAGSLSSIRGRPAANWSHGVRLIIGLRRSRPTGGLFRQMYPPQLEKLFLVVLMTRKGRTAFSLVHVSVASSFCHCVGIYSREGQKNGATER